MNIVYLLFFTANVDTVEMKQNGASNGSFTQPPAYSEDNKNKKVTYQMIK